MIDNPVPWPDGARCAVAFTFDMDAESGLHLNYPDSADNRVAASAMLRYGPEVAVPRLVNVFRDLGLRQTFFVPGWCVEHYPRAIKLLVENGHEIAHHGYLHEKPNQLTPVDERRVLERGIRAIEQATGERPRGYRAPSYAFSKHTLDYLIEEGFRYDSSLPGDDIPYLVEGAGGRIVEVPADVTMDDWPQYVHYKDLGCTMPIASPARAMEVFKAEFEAAWKHAGMWMTVWHPFVSGRLARCDAMVEMIEHIRGRGKIWFATVEAIAAHVETCISEGRWRPRVDRLPYHQSPIEAIGESRHRTAKLET